jgi:F-type H+-transporting ATPase subunit epsilon
MSNLFLKIITPKNILIEKEINSITLPTSKGEITILPHHVPLFSNVVEGLITVRIKDDEEYFSIGGGYVETDGKNISILVSRAYGQDQIDEQEIVTAKSKAENMIKISKTDSERQEALASLRRTTIDMKLLGKIKKKTRKQ